MSHIHITDTRPEGDPSLDVVPRMTDFDNAQDLFRLQVDRSRGWSAAPLGQACWKLVGFELRSGPAEYKVRVLQRNGQPCPNIVVYHHWPGAPQLPGNVKPPYLDHGEGRFTNGLGEAVFGGASVAGANGGSDTIWVSASPPGMEPQFSDAVRNLGRHDVTGLIPNPLFQNATQDGSDLASADEGYTLAIVAGGHEIGRVKFNQGTTGDNCLILRKGIVDLGRVRWDPKPPGGP